MTLAASRVDDFGRIIPVSPIRRSRSPSSSRSPSPGRGFRRRHSRSRSPPRRRRSLSPRFDRHRRTGPRGYRMRTPPRQRGAPRLPLEGPLLSFKEFMDLQQSNLPSGSAQVSYNQYKNEFVLRQDRKFFHQYKDEEWLQERYNPLTVIQRANRAVEKTAAQREAFLHDLNQPNPEKLIPSILFDVVSTENDTMDTVVEDNASFYDNSLFLRHVPSSLTRQLLIDTLSKAPGFVKLLLSEPNRQRGYQRHGWAVYQSQENCAEALRQLQGKPVNSWYTLSLAANSAPSRQAKFAPSIANTQARYQIDLQQGLALAHKLDSECDLEPFQIPASFVDDTLRSLNIVQAYLRRVHHACYYCALCAIDEEELVSKCHIPHRRASLPSSDEESVTDSASPAFDQWASELDNKILARIAASAPSRNEEVVRRTALEPFIKAQTSQEADSKFRCGLCAKLFRGAEFVAKHLRLKHTAECEEEIINRIRTSFFEAFRADPDRPTLPPSAPTVTENTSRALGNATGRSVRGNNARPGRRPFESRYARNDQPATSHHAPVPEHLRRRNVVSYADLDAPLWSPPKRKTKLDYGFGNSKSNSNSNNDDVDMA